MKERPILFSGEMVRAILDGRKTQTRRVVNQKHLPFLTNILDGFLDGKWNQRPLPYGKPGDGLWVRETWKPGAWRDDGRIAIDYKASPELTKTPWVRLPDDGTGDNFDDLWIKLTDELLAAGSVPDENGYHHWEPGKSPVKWRPSIFMPRWASRINLRVTGIRVERVQDITPSDYRAEGINLSYDAKMNSLQVEPMYKARWVTLWNAINATRPGCSWDANPWVWVVEFEVMQ
jgi:hypothetical protein